MVERVAISKFALRNAKYAYRAKKGPQPDAKNNGGAPTKYKPEYAEQAYKLCLLGAGDRQLADFFDTTPETLHQWCFRNPKFADRIKAGKITADAEIAKALYHRAKGYSHKAEKLIAVAQGEGVSVVERHPYIEHYPPDTGAAKWWLAHRQPEFWQERQLVEVTGKNGAPIQSANVNITATLDPTEAARAYRKMVGED